MLIEKQLFWDKLTYSTKKQALELIRNKRRVNIYNGFNIGILFVSLIAVTSAYFITKNYIQALVVLIAVGFFIIVVSKMVESVMEEYNKLRGLLIDRLDIEFCNCSEKTCNCREKFVIYMDENEHINLSY